MKIMTFNVQHCKCYRTGEIDYKLFGETLRQIGADVVGINEIYGGGEGSRFGDQVARLAELGGYPYFYFAKAISVEGRSPYGNAILSRIPIAEVRVLPIPDPPAEGRIGTYHYETRCILKSRLENGAWVLVTHMGLNPEEHENARDAVLSALEPERCILMGDFNMSPDHEVIAAISAHMVDAAHCFREPLLSFPSDKPIKKIDYVFASPDLHVSAADIPALVVSDHRPHIAEINR